LGEPAISESSDSAAPALTRAVAASLTGRAFDPVQTTLWQRGLAAFLERVWPASLPRIVRWQSRRSALPLSAAARVDLEAMASARIQRYRAAKGPFGCVFVGSALGSAAYLAAACEAPFLPEPFILGFRGGSPSDDLPAHLARAKEIAGPILASNPDAMLISHFDPVHDGWLTRHLNHLRLKPLRLPGAYRRFLLDRLEPGGTIVHLACEAEWLRYRLGPRHVYQVGGWGDIGPREFLQGSARIDSFLQASGSPHRGGWQVAGVEPSFGPESEWGSEPGFGNALSVFARQHGFTYWPVRWALPHAYSLWALIAFRRWYQRHGEEPMGTFVGAFNQYAPGRVIARRLLPVWLVFNTTDSADFLRHIKSRLKAAPVAFAALITFSRTPDQVTWEGWRAALSGLHWTSIGARKRWYPEDVTSLWRWPSRLEACFPVCDRPTLPKMTIDILRASYDEVEAAGSSGLRSPGEPG
jgi:hypothetical protein